MSPSSLKSIEARLDVYNSGFRRLVTRTERGFAIGPLPEPVSGITPGAPGGLLAEVVAYPLAELTIRDGGAADILLLGYFFLMISEFPDDVKKNMFASNSLLSLLFDCNN